MPRVLYPAALALALGLWGCANPADDKVKVKAVEPTKAAGAAEEDPVAAAKRIEAELRAEPGALEITPANSKIGFVGSKVTGSHTGGFKSFRGVATVIKYDETVPPGAGPASHFPAGVVVEIDMDSVWTDNDNLTGHLKSPEFFEVARFPKAYFRTISSGTTSEKPGVTTVTGLLTLHGVTKQIEIPFKSTFKDGELTLASEFAINRKDFGIVYPGKPDDLIRDEVVIKIDARAGKATKTAEPAEAGAERSK